MAGSLTDTAENTVADYIASLATHIALYTVAPTDSTTGTEVTDANGYARQVVVWTAAANGAFENEGAITFPQSTGAQGTIVAMAGVTSATHGAGSIIFYTTLDETKTIGNTDQLIVPDGGFDFSLT